MGNKVRVNDIRNNGQLAIDLGNDGMTPNDAGDADAGANNLLNTPTLADVYANATGTYVHVQFDGAPATTYEVEYSRSFAPNPPASRLSLTGWLPIGGIAVAGDYLYAQDSARKGRENVRRYRLSSLHEAFEHLPEACDRARSGGWDSWPRRR